MAKLKKTSFLLAVAIIAGSFTSKPALTAIALQSHQDKAVQYFLKHPDQKGLLLFHSLGSGKTYIALDYAERYPEKRVVIVLPEFLRSSWITQMKAYGVKDMSRYQMVALNDSEQLLKYDLRNSIVVVDEIHRLIQKIRLSPSQISERYIAVYEKLRTSGKLLVLTGTPIFVDTSDIAYIANLFDEKQPYPIDSVKFRTEFMRIKPVTSLVRGHVTESKLMLVSVPFVVTLMSVVTLGTSLPWAIPLATLAGTATLPVVNELFPVSSVSFREFDTDKWKDFASKYISYYRVQLANDENYPTKDVTERKVTYNDYQTNFFLSFVDEDLNLEQLKIMLAEEGNLHSDSYLRMHSSNLQKQLLENTLSGREIGNLESRLGSPREAVVEAPKFLEVLKVIRKKPGQVAVYSGYYANGIKKFAAFLERQGFGNQYEILSPDLPVDEQIAVVARYNQGKKRIILIHPEITEGISLLGTEQFHILEPISNAALLDQIVGRSIRYKSHVHLPRDRQKVNVYLWESEIDYSTFGIPTSAGLLRREHWQRKYSEVNPSMWTKGIVEVDSTYFLKNETPDSRVKRHISAIKKDTASFEDLLESYSIEKY